MITAHERNQLQILLDGLHKEGSKRAEFEQPQEWYWVDLIEKLIRQNEILQKSYKFEPEETDYYTIKCFKCDWWGSTKLADGGGQIADTGDCDDLHCPICGSTEMEEITDKWVTMKQFLIEEIEAYKQGDRDE